MSLRHKWAIHRIMTIVWVTFNNIKKQQAIHILITIERRHILLDHFRGLQHKKAVHKIMKIV